MLLPIVPKKLNATSTSSMTISDSIRSSAKRCIESERRPVTNFRNFAKKHNRGSKQSRKSLATKFEPFSTMSNAPNTMNSDAKWTNGGGIEIEIQRMTVSRKATAGNVLINQRF